MISQGLLRDATEAVMHSNGAVTPALIQRRIRVGFATAAQLCEGLEAAGVLGEIGRGGRRMVLASEAYWAHRMVAEAIDDGRIELSYPETEATS